MAAPGPYRHLGDRLRAARQAQHLPQRWVGARLGVGQGMIAQYEQGLTRPRLSRLVRYAALLRIDPVELLAEAGYLQDRDAAIVRLSPSTRRATPERR